ncbi:MAG TPA: dihydrodipicolinate reductase [Thermoanaerobaculia bacterium]|nr:dihydrodipicolinate reductase [Thermoanaerobaculia bacterium]
MVSVQPITVAQYGLGPIGSEIARLLTTKRWARLVAAVDIDPAKVGRDAGEVIDLGRNVGVTVTPRLQTRANVVVHSTGSRLRAVRDQLLALLGSGSHVVSTCEELAFPLDVDIREELQQVARANNVTLLGTGVNPGFVMDKLPLTLTAVCQEVETLDVIRVVDASLRREPLQRKVGAGMTREQFNEAVRDGRIKHMGLRESLMLVANGLGVELDAVGEEQILPVMAEQRVVTQYLEVEPGQVAGVHQMIRGERKGGIRLNLDIKMYVGARDPRDEVVVAGIPDLRMRIDGGVHGDRATAAMAVNSIPRVVAARPGVLTMDDIPISFR